MPTMPTIDPRSTSAAKEAEFEDLKQRIHSKLVDKLDWWALYTIHQDVVKDGKDPQELAQSLIKGYDPAKIRAQMAKEEARKKREEERKMPAKEAARKKAEARRKAAAAKALTVLARDNIMVGGIVTRIDPNKCSGCLGCINVCPFGAITFNTDKKIAEVNPALCKGCGACAAACPSEAPVLMGFSNQQLYAQIKSAMAC